MLCLLGRQHGAAQPKQSDSLSAPADFGWPRQIEKNGNTLVYYQPQLESWDDFKTLKAKMALALTIGGKTIMGVTDLQAKTIIDKEAHTAYLKNIEVKDVRFASLTDEENKKMEQVLNDLLPKNGDPIAVERLSAELEKNNTPPRTIETKNDAPQIFFSQTPAVVLIVEGKPVLVPIEGTEMSYIVNTNWDLFFDKPTSQYYLLVEKNWLTSKDLEGPWVATRNLPADLSKLPNEQNFDDVKRMVPAPTAAAPPKIFFSSQPAEIISVDGPPKFTKIANTSLLFIANTESEVFACKNDGLYYLLISGRWFSAKELQGPWTYASEKLPKEFAKIPKDSPKVYVLSSVPGTQEASDAVLLAQIPTTALVNRKEAEKKVKVVYDGDPQFKPIEGTSLQYATNTQEKVIQVGNDYYVCYQGVWLVSSKPEGPWKVADMIPKEIYNIPSNSPVYNVTYVTQNKVDEETVESSSTAGYFGMFAIGMTMGAVMCYGTGWYYPPYMYYPPHMMYPVYRPYPYAYGRGYSYNPYTGAYGGYKRAYGPYGGAGSSAWYNPSTGRYGRAATVQTPGGGRTAAGGYNPYTGGYGYTKQGHNPYGSWGSSVASRGGDWVQTGHINGAKGSAAGYKTSTGKSGAAVSGAGGGKAVKTNNGVYAGKDGNVYRKEGDGSWSKYNNQDGSWSQAGRGDQAQQLPSDGRGEGNRGQNKPSQQPAGDGNRGQNKPSQQPAGDANRGQGDRSNPAPKQNNTMSDQTRQDLNNSARSRERGQQNTNRYQNSQRSGGFGGGGFGGGGFRGGGGGGRRR